jgi:hypothetical protein
MKTLELADDLLHFDTSSDLLHFDTSSYLKISPWPITFQMSNGDTVLTIDGDGKIIVNPDAPADETAREVCNILATMILPSFPSSELVLAAKDVVRLYGCFGQNVGELDDREKQLFERLKNAVKGL